MLNKIILKGNLGRDPEIQVTQDGRKIAKFSLATSSMWRDRAQEWHKHTNWHKIIVYRETTVRWIKDVLKKGDLVYVEGKLMYKHHKDKDGNFHWTTYITISQDGCVEHLRSRHLNLEEEIVCPGLEGKLEEIISELPDPNTPNSEDLDSEDLFFEEPQSPNQSQQPKGETS